MRIVFSYILIFISTSVIYSQSNSRKKEKVDSLKQILMQDSSHIFRVTKAKPYLRLESRNSFINKEPVRLFGFLAGATFFERHVLCAGFYFLDKSKDNPLALLDQNTNTNHFLSLNYLDFSYQYVLLNFKYIQLNIPLEMGYGKYKVDITDNSNNIIGTSNGNVAPISGGAQLIFKPIKWLGISAMGGYRFIKQKEGLLSLRGWYYTAGVWVDARHLIRNFNYYVLKKRKYKKELKNLH